MDDLKNLMIQTLEANGILGQLRAQIRCSVFKIIDNQDDMENPRTRGKSALHWENQKARECLEKNGANGILLAELIREFLEFYRLDYTKQIYLPESNLGSKKQSSTEELIAQSGLSQNEINKNKPLLLQILEKFLSGSGPSLPKSASKDGSSPAPGISFSDQKDLGPLSMGAGILPASRSPPKEDEAGTSKHIDKANSLLDELSREERSGFKAEIAGLSNIEKSSDKVSGLADDKKVSEAEPSNYEDEFEEIDEDLPEAVDDASDRLPGVSKIGESHGITVS